MWNVVKIYVVEIFFSFIYVMGDLVLVEKFIN